MARSQERITAPATSLGHEIGRRLAALRARRRLTLRQLAERAGISDAYISQLEQGRAAPSLATLERLAGALDVHLVDFLDEGHGVVLEEIVVRADSRPLCRSLRANVQVHLLAPAIGERQLSPYLVHAPPGSGSEGTHTHSGEDFGYVLRGEFALRVGPEEVRLGPGDSFAFPGTRPHGFRNPGQELAEVIWVVSDRNSEPG